MARPSDPNARQRLLDAARAEFVSRGLDRTRVEDIARRAELSKGAFYLHFESKEQIFDELVLAVATALESMLDETCDFSRGDEQSLEQVLRTCFQQDLRIFEFISDNCGMMALMLDGGGSGRHRHLIERFAERTERVVAEGLRRGVQGGFYRDDLDIESAAAFIAGGYDRVARNLVKSLLEGTAKYDLASHLSHTVRQVIVGVGTLELGAAARALLPAFAAEAAFSTGASSTGDGPSPPEGNDMKPRR